MLNSVSSNLLNLYNNTSIPSTNAINNNNANTSSVFSRINSIGQSASDSFESLTNVQNDINSADGKNNTNDIEAKIEEYNKLAENYQSSIEAIDKLIENLKEQLKKAQAEYEEYQAKYEAKKEKYGELEAKYAAKAEQYEQIEKLIEKAVEKSEKQAQQDKKNAIYEAMANYDEEKDGDYQAYIQKSLEGVIDNDSLTALSANLATQASDVLSELGSLKSEMAYVGSEMNAAKTKMDLQAITVNGIEGNISAQESAKATLAEKMQNLQAEIGNYALASISDEEKALVRDNNIDLTEKFPDGSPKYIVALGKSDNKYHIYEMNGQGSSSATTLARKYGQNGGFDIVASGNGYMNGLKDATEANICNTVFSFDCVSDDLCSGKANADNKCYCTCSPLSLDINGDGVKTSDKIISYDIDGDGEKDNIFDSADAVLVFDNDGDGISGEDGSECFGNNTDIDGDGKKDGFKDGFEALKALAGKFGLINGKDDNVLDENDINFLEENAGLKIKLDGYNSQATSLKDSGITEINLATTDETIMEDDFDGFGNQLMHQTGATFKVFGEEREYADIWHRKIK